MGANIIEDNSGDAAQQLIDNIREKGNRENCPKNLIVERDTTYNRPLSQATHRYPTQNIIQQVHIKPIKETRTQLDELQRNGASVWAPQNNR